MIYDTIAGGASSGQPSVGDSDYVVGSLRYLDKAFKWAQKWGIGVVLDMHAVPGAQNYKDASSPPQRGGLFWYMYSNNVDRAVDSLQKLFERYAAHPAFLGAVFLDSPDASVDSNVLRE